MGEQDDRMVEVTDNQDGLLTSERRQEGGVILVDTGRRMMWWSAAMEAALQRSGLRWWRGMRCCDALGCSDESSGCLTDQALLAPEGLESRPWRTSHEDGVLGGTVSARAIRLGKEEMVAFELHFHDAPTRTAPPARDVTVAALGRVSVTVDGRLRDGDWLQQRPGQVFRYLLASREGPSAPRRSPARSGRSAVRRRSRTSGTASSSCGSSWKEAIRPALS